MSRQLRAARRADASGSGPTLADRPAARFPGATERFQLFGEVLLVGLLITVASLAIVTLPAALAAGVRHLRRHLNAERATVGQYWRDWARAIPGGVLVGLAAATAGAILAVNITLALSGALVGGPIVLGTAVAGVLAIVIALLTAGGSWAPETGWQAALRQVPVSLRADPAAAAYLAVAGALVGVAAWMLLPLIAPALGCAALAVIAVPARRRRASA